MCWSEIAVGKDKTDPLEKVLKSFKCSFILFFSQTMTLQVPLDLMSGKSFHIGEMAIDAAAGLRNRRPRPVMRSASRLEA